VGGERAVAQLQHVANNGEPLGGSAGPEHLESRRQRGGAAVIAVVDNGGALEAIHHLAAVLGRGELTDPSGGLGDADAEAGGDGRRGAASSRR